LLPGRLEVLDDARANRAEVGLVEHVLELVEEVGVELAAQREQPAEPGGQQLARLRERLLEFAEHHAVDGAPARQPPWLPEAAARSFSRSMRTRSRMPFTNAPELAVEYFLPSSMASLIATFGGTTAQCASSKIA